MFVALVGLIATLAVVQLLGRPSTTATTAVSNTNQPRAANTNGVVTDGVGVTVYAVGDIADCGNDNDTAAAALLTGTSGDILTLGDTVYDWGTAEDFTNCFVPSWGPLKSRIRPAVGNHEYNTKGAAPYFAYFGAAAGDPTRGYYSFEIGIWHIIVLNSNCWAVDGCGIDSPQYTWLAADLAAHPTGCALATYHHPAFSSGLHEDQTSVLPLWQALADGGVDLVLNGHDHDYERFAQMDRLGRADPAGMREIVVGTGGKSLYPTAVPHSTSEVRNNSTYGVLQLTLKDHAYDWVFLPVAGASFSDHGTGDCR